METFGLLNFLKNALLSSSPAAQTESEPNLPDQTPATPVPPSAATQNDPLPATQTEKQNAFLHFMEAHDARAKRAKKP